MHSFGDVREYRDKHWQSELLEQLGNGEHTWTSMSHRSASTGHPLAPATIACDTKVSTEGFSDLWPLEGSKHYKSAGRHHLLNTDPKARAGRGFAVLFHNSLEVLAVLPWRNMSSGPGGRKDLLARHSHNQQPLYLYQTFTVWCLGMVLLKDVCDDQEIWAFENNFA